MSNATDLGISVLLWIGKAVPLPAPPWFAQALQRVEVSTDAGGNSGFQLTLALSKDTPIDYSGLLAGTVDPYNRVIVGVLIGAVPEILIDGIITHQQFVPSEQPGKTTVTVTGQDVTAVMDLQQRTQPYPNLPDHAVAALVLARYAAYGVVPAPAPTVDVPLAIYRQTSQTRQTDLRFVQHLAKRNGYVFYVEPVSLGVNLAYFGPDVRFGVPQPALTANMGAASNVVSMSFDHDPLKPVSTSGALLDTTIPLPLPVPLPAPPLPYLPPLALLPTLPRRTEELECVASASLPQALGEILGVMAPGLDAVTCQGTLDGVRYGGVLKARRPVGVRGVGFSYDGFYYVKRVTHTFEGGKYTQGFSLAREGLGALSPAVVP